MVTREGHAAVVPSHLVEYASIMSMASGCGGRGYPWMSEVEVHDEGLEMGSMDGVGRARSPASAVSVGLLN